MLFREIPAAQVVLRVRGGIYKQVPIYARGRQLFAKYAGGFIALKSFGQDTSHPNVNWDEIDGIDFTTERLPTGDANLVLTETLRAIA